MRSISDFWVNIASKMGLVRRYWTMRLTQSLVDMDSFRIFERELLRFSNFSLKFPSFL